MKPAINHAQGRPEASHGSRELEVTKLPALRGRVAHEAVHSHHLGIAVNPKARAAVAMVRLVATGRTYSIPITRGVPAAERRRRSILPDVGGRRSAASASRLRQIARILAARVPSRRGNAKPSDVDACFPEPFIEPSHLHVLSAVRGLNDRDRDRERFAHVRTAFQGSRNVFRG